MQPAGPNAEQIEFWNDRAGARWLAADLHFAQMLSPIGDALVERAAPRVGERVLDVGCGAGQTSAVLAQAVTNRGRVLGADISAPLVGGAVARALKLGLAHASFVEADAQTHDFGTGAFDLVCSRFGVMFFADPVAAFANLADATATGGRLAFVCWRSLRENPWFAGPLAAMAKHVEPPPPPPPGGPGPFAFADRARVQSLLERAGWADVRIEPADISLWIGASVDDALRFASDIGPTATSLAQAEPIARDAALAQMRDVYAGATDGDGVVRMPAALWYVTATR